MIVKRKQPIYSGTAFDAVQKELPDALKEAMNKSGWNVFGVYELVKTVLAKERAAEKTEKGSNVELRGCALLRSPA